MAKPKTLVQLRAEKERAETQLAQEQHKLQRLENRKQYYEKGERSKRTHRLFTGGFLHEQYHSQQHQQQPLPDCQKADRQDHLSNTGCTIEAKELPQADEAHECRGIC